MQRRSPASRGGRPAPESYTLYEYACYEGNRAVTNILGSARILEQKQRGRASQSRATDRVVWPTLAKGFSSDQFWQRDKLLKIRGLRRVDRPYYPCLSKLDCTFLDKTHAGSRRPRSRHDAARRPELLKEIPDSAPFVRRRQPIRQLRYQHFV